MAEVRGISRELQAELTRMARRLAALESAATARASTTTASASASSGAVAILAPANLAATARVGTQTRLAREDHIHQYPHPYEHTQASADTVWTVDHALGYYPASIYAEDAAGDELNGDVEYVSTSQLTLTFTTAVDGLARVS